MKPPSMARSKSMKAISVVIVKASAGGAQAGQAEVDEDHNDEARGEARAEFQRANREYRQVGKIGEPSRQTVRGDGFGVGIFDEERAEQRHGGECDND